MALRSLEFFVTPEFREFMDDVNRIDRLDLLIIKGTALLQDMLVAIAAHRQGGDEAVLRKAPLAKVARAALGRPEEARLLELVLETARVRNQPAHELKTDFVEPFRVLWEKLRGDATWPTDPVHQRDYCQSFFVMLMFELHRCGYDRPPSEHISGERAIDWERLRRMHEGGRQGRR